MSPKRLSADASRFSLLANDAGNYTLSAPTASASANITPKPVAVSGISAVDRVYDGTLVVQVSAATPQVSGLIAGDDVSAVLPVGGISSGSMLDRHAGQAKPISVTGLTLDGADAANYTLSGSAGTVNIAPKPITVAYTGVNKVYDRTVNASVSGSNTRVAAPGWPSQTAVPSRSIKAPYAAPSRHQPSR